MVKTYQQQKQLETPEFNTTKKCNKQIDEWKKHKRPGKYPKLEKEYIDKESSLNWLKNGTVGYDGEGILISEQVQGLLTNGFKKMAGI